MKKNLLSIIILFLLIINISLTGVMVFSLVTTNQRAIALMTDVSTVLRLELPSGGEYVVPTVPIRNVTTYNVAGGESMTIPLRSAEDEAVTRYMMVRISLSMDSKNRGYRNNGDGDLSAVDSMIQDIITRSFARYNSSEVRDIAVLDAIRSDILRDLHILYESDFIFNVSFLDIRYQ
ncbi:MAG: flagellar basal body-associated FliL family protein [Lachnospiraceae bacterium]|jgi:flagellar FliL protein|nr:flagellar basal body-associated FliL family protein [Lachnospiraceae bacterium]